MPEDYASNSWYGFKNLIKGHNKVTDNAVSATCTTAGLTEGTHCSYCGKVLVAQEVIPASHTYNNTITAPTCTEVGYTTHTCSVCEYTYNSDTVVANGHNYSTAITAPTCTAVGYTTHTCSVCEYTYNSDTVIANGHVADSVEFENIMPATCTATGTKDSVVFCSVCQVEMSREKRTIPAIGHTIVIDEAVEPTCTETGLGEGKHCSVCNDTLLKQDTIAALGHTEVIDAAVPATCTTAGKTEGKHCSVCNAVLVAQEEIPALGHEFKTYSFDNNATTEADGTETAVCERGCGATDTRTAAGTKIAATPEKGTAVAESAANAVNIYAAGNKIVVENATDEIFVYNAMGVLVCRDDACRVRQITVNTPGVYIVKTGGTVKRVVVN